jgi:hypothetical protein
MIPVWRFSALALGALLLAQTPPALASGARYIGFAHDLDSGRLIYSEIHEETSRDGRPQRLRTEYRSADGALIARRDVRFGIDPLLPDFEMRDENGELLEGLRRQDDRLSVLHRRDGQRLREATLAIDAADVADAGFTQLILARWDTLVSGAIERFDFVVPSRLGTVPMRLRKVARGEVLGEPAVTFNLELANPLLRWLVDPIQVTFHAERRELLRYVGISNMRKAPGENFRVRIDFPPAQRQVAAP